MRYLPVTLLVLCFANGVYASTFFYPGLPHPEEFEYYSGILEAQKGNYQLAKRYLESGWKRSRKAQFLPELAGVSYRLGDRKRAKEYLFQILKKDPRNRYANHFLGTIFLLDGNLEACLKYWNRIGEPLIEDIKIRPLPRVDPEMMDRAFAIAPASQLKLEDYLATASRLQAMDLFRRYQFRLKPYQAARKFDLLFEPLMKKNSLGSRMKIAALAGQAIFTETITPEFHNIGGTTISSQSLISWDEFQNRFYTSLSLPLGDKPHHRIRTFADVRKETWALKTDQDLTKWETGWEYVESVNGKINWSGGTKISHRQYGRVTPVSLPFQEGWGMHVFGSIDYSLLRIPEKRITLSSTFSTELGKLLAGSSYFTLTQSLRFQWVPRSTGEDLAMNAQFRTGRIFGASPFDEYFVLGVERDSDLLLRAHKSSIDKKGENPFSSGYSLWNWDISKIVFDKKLVRCRLAPFVDVGAVFDSDLWDGKDWFFDTGIQSGFQVLKSIEVVFTYGKDLQSGRNVFYVSARL